MECCEELGRTGGGRASMIRGRAPDHLKTVRRSEEGREKTAAVLSKGCLKIHTCIASLGGYYAPQLCSTKLDKSKSSKYVTSTELYQGQALT